MSRFNVKSPLISLISVAQSQHWCVLLFFVSVLAGLLRMPVEAQTLTAGSPAQVVAGATTAVTLSGSGFVAGTVVLVNNTPVATTYQSATSVIAQVALNASVTGNISVQAQNPSGTTSTALQLPVWSIQIIATTPDGNNTGTERLGVTLGLATTITAGSHTSVTWTMQGAGSLATKGGQANYTPPATLPSNTSVTLTAYSSSYPSVTTSYTFSLGYPLPTIKSVSPSTLIPAGATSTVTLTGTGFIPGTVISSNIGSVTATYQSATSMTALVSVPGTAVGGALSLQVTNSAPLGGTSAAVQIPIYSIQLAASNPDGNNTGTARLGVPVSLATTINAGSMQAVTWSLQGAGTLSGSSSAGATYTPPQTMPANQSVVISASMNSNSAIATSYSMTLINPIPVVSSASPSQLLLGSTQAVAVVGTGFIAGTTVTMNGSALATTVSDYKHLSVQVPVAANASGQLNLQVQNPAPGGGAGSSFVETLPASSITLTATDVDGVNTGTAEPGITVTMSATVSGVAQTSINWTVSGAGSISSNGVYTAPASVPANNAVTITASLIANPAVTASYQFNLINPPPTVASANPAQVPAGATTSVTLTGSGFVPGTVILSNAGTVTATYQSPTSMVVQITTPATAPASLSLQAQNATPGGGTSAALSLPIWSVSITATNTDGVNTGTADLGVPVSFTANPNAGNYQSVTWSLQGAGHPLQCQQQRRSDVHPPQSMPANTTAVITASMSSYLSVTTTYSMNLTNPTPVVSSASPSQLLTGSTQTVTLTGSGFVAGTTVSLKGTALATTFTDYNHLSVQVPVAANATGTLSLVPQNPTPGGGAGTAFSEALAAASITLTATDQDGVNTGTAEAGINVTMTAAVAGSTQTALTWSVTGAGSITTGGVYTAPLTIPTNNAVTITATLVSNSSVTATYQLNLINFAPTISSVSPAQVPAGTTTSVTLTGTGFLPGTVIVASAGTVTATYQSATSMLVQVTLPASAPSSLSLQAQNAAPGGGTSAASQIAVWSIQISATNTDGTNTGNADLGVPVSLSTIANAGSYKSATWSLQGPGTLSNVNSSGGVTYTPPLSMPANTTAVITASLTSYPSVTTSYSMSLTNPTPVVSTASPSQLLPGSTQTLALTGSGFVAGTTVTLKGASLTTTFTDYNHVSVQVPVAASATGSLSLIPVNPTPGGGAGTAFSEALAGTSITLTAVDQDGTNTGTAELGINVTMTAAVKGSAQTAVTWSVTGAGHDHQQRRVYRAYSGDEQQ